MYVGFTQFTSELGIFFNSYSLIIYDYEGNSIFENFSKLFDFSLLSSNTFSLGIIVSPPIIL